jgi:pimeloyl-ACP methyl ester carboxylesterase
MTTPSIYKSPAGEREIMALYDAVLARWPAPHTTARIATRHGGTFVVASGPDGAPPMILLHGSSSNAMSWVGDVAAYSRHFRVFAVDLPGEPGRSDPHRPSWAGPDFAEWLEDVLNGLNLPTASLLGISQGGWTALKFATREPGRVDKLALLAPGGVAPMRVSFLLRTIPLSLLGRRGAEAVNRVVFGKQPLHPEAVAFMNAIMTHFRPRIEPQALYTDEELRRLAMPVLLIVGAQDALFPAQKIAARLQGLLPALTAQMLPDAGHVLHNTAERVVPFLVEGRG